MTGLRALLGDLFGLLYIGSPVLMVVFFAGVALLGLASVGVAVVAAWRRRWRLALVATLLAVPTAPLGTFVIGVADGVAWPGRYAPLEEAALVGEYRRAELDLVVDLDADGGFEIRGRDWAPALRRGTWRVVPAPDWGPAHSAGQLLLVGEDGAEHALAVGRPLALHLGPVDLTVPALHVLQEGQRSQGAHVSDYHPFLPGR